MKLYNGIRASVTVDEKKLMWKHSTIFSATHNIIGIEFVYISAWESPMQIYIVYLSSAG